MRHIGDDGPAQQCQAGPGFWGLLTDGERDALASLGLYRKYPPGATICREGDPAAHLFVLTSGWVKVVSATSTGREVVLALRGHGDVVGEIAGETTGHRSATMQAIDAVQALMVRYDRFSKFLDSNPGAARAYRHIMTRRWSDAARMLRSLADTDGAQRLARLLLDLAERQGVEADGSIDLAMPLSQEELASLAGTSRATCTRALRKWRERGFIRTGSRSITVIDIGALRRATGEPGQETSESKNSHGGYAVDTTEAHARLRPDTRGESRQQAGR